MRIAKEYAIKMRRYTFCWCSSPQPIHIKEGASQWNLAIIAENQSRVGHIFKTPWVTCEATPHHHTVIIKYNIPQHTSYTLTLRSLTWKNRIIGQQWFPEFISALNFLPSLFIWQRGSLAFGLTTHPRLAKIVYVQEIKLLCFLLHNDLLSLYFRQHPNPASRDMFCIFRL